MHADDRPASDRLGQLSGLEFEGLVAALIEADAEPGAKVSEQALEVRIGPLAIRRNDITIRHADETLELVEVWAPDAELRPAYIASRVRQMAETKDARRLHVAFARALPAELATALREAAGEIEIVVWQPVDIERALVTHPEIEARFFELQPVEQRRRLERVLIDLAPETPKAYKASGPVRLALVLLIVALLVWSPIPRLSKQDAIWVGAIGLVLLLLVYSSTRVSRRWFGDRMEQASDAVGAVSLSASTPLKLDVEWSLQRLPQARIGLLTLAVGFVVFRALRYLGGLLYGLGFFLGWALLYLLVWGLDPAGCAASSCAGPFAGVDMTARLGDFMSLAVGTAFLSPPTAPEASSHLAQGLVTAELVSAAAILVGFATQLGIGVRTGSTEPGEAGF